MSGNNRYGVFSQCAASFSGQRDPAAVEDFLSAICIYKEINAISNTDALRELPLLLDDYAASWWIGVQDTLCTFEQAVALIRSTFSPPDWLIFVDFFEVKQQKNEPTDSFVSKKRYLLSQLKMPPSEIIQLNMVYAMLTRSIRDRLQRENINTFEDLITASREAEILILEAPVEQNKAEEKKMRCCFCRCRGHGIENCLKRKKRDEEFGQQEDQSSMGNKDALTHVSDHKRKPVFSCHGCGAPNIFRSKCSPCNSNWTAKNNQQYLSSNSITSPSIGHSLPTMNVKFFGTKHEVVLNTGAKTSVANLKLKQLLDTNGCLFQDVCADITLADGTLITTNVMTTTCSIYVAGRTLEIKLIHVPSAKNERSLLGTDFLEQIGISLNMAQRYWFFEDEPKQKHNFTNSMEKKNLLPKNNDSQFTEHLDVLTNLSSIQSSSSLSPNSYAPPAKTRKVPHSESREELLASLF